MAKNSNTIPTMHGSSAMTKSNKTVQPYNLYLESFKLLQHVADDPGGCRLVNIGHGSPARLGTKRLAQPTNTASRTQVYLASDRSCS